MFNLPSGFKGEDVWKCWRTEDGCRSHQYTISSSVRHWLSWAKNIILFSFRNQSPTHTLLWPWTFHAMEIVDVNLSLYRQSIWGLLDASGTPIKTNIQSIYYHKPPNKHICSYKRTLNSWIYPPYCKSGNCICEVCGKKKPSWKIPNLQYMKFGRNQVTNNLVNKFKGTGSGHFGGHPGKCSSNKTHFWTRVRDWYLSVTFITSSYSGTFWMMTLNKLDNYIIIANMKS